MGGIVVDSDDATAWLEDRGEPLCRVAETAPQVEYRCRRDQAPEGRNELHLWSPGIVQAATVLSLMRFASRSHLGERITTRKRKQLVGDIDVHRSSFARSTGRAT